MDQSGLTVFFQEPFWVGVFERVDGGRLSVCRVTFGAEPKDYEVYAYVLARYDSLSFSPAVDAETRAAAGSPKRRRRQARKLLSRTGTGTKSQQALQAQRDTVKTERVQQNREAREEAARRLYALKQQKRKEKHRGH